MIRYICLLTISLMFCPLLSIAQSIRLPSDTVINFTLPSDRWDVSVEAPELAIEAMVADMVYGRQTNGISFDRKELLERAKNLIKVNNLFIYNAGTEAYLMASFSPHGQREKPLSKKLIQRSVRWTVEALDDHAGVSDLALSQTTVEPVEIPGIEYAQQITSNNPLFGNPHKFTGIVGYAYPYWIFIYYNDKVKDSTDYSEMQQILKSIKLTAP
jgi:hypothetical protein